MQETSRLDKLGKNFLEQPKEEQKLDYPLTDQTFLSNLLKKNLQMYATVREYKVRGADLTSLIPEHSNIKRSETAEYIFRLRLEMPTIDIYKNQSYRTNFKNTSETHDTKTIKTS